jgi:hypothetical protein
MVGAEFLPFTIFQVRIEIPGCAVRMYGSGPPVLVTKQQHDVDKTRDYCKIRNMQNINLGNDWKIHQSHNVSFTKLVKPYQNCSTITSINDCGDVSTKLLIQVSRSIQYLENTWFLICAN